MLNMVRHYFGYSDSQIVQELRTDAILGGEDKLIENLAELLHKGLHIIIDELEGYIELPEPICINLWEICTVADIINYRVFDIDITGEDYVEEAYIANEFEDRLTPIVRRIVGSIDVNWKGYYIKARY